MSEKRFTDSVVIVTGAGTGIGRATALAFALKGAKVVLAELDGKAAARVAQEIRKQNGVALEIATDVSDLYSVQTLIEKVKLEFGRVGITKYCFAPDTELTYSLSFASLDP